MKGKYAARAANRVATLDNQIITDLRADLKSVEAERDQALADLENLRRDHDGQVLRQVTERIAAEREALRTQLAAERDQMRQAMVAAAEDLTVLLVTWYHGMVERYGKDDIVFHRSFFDPIDYEGPSLLRVFDALCPDRAGQLMERILTVGGDLPFAYVGPPRARKRRSAREVSRDVKYNDRRIARRELKKKFAPNNGTAGNEQAT